MTLTDSLAHSCVALLAERAISSGPVILLAEGERRAERLTAVLRAFAPDLPVVLFPPWDCLPYDRASPSREAMGRRTAALRAMADAGSDAIIVTSPEAIVQRVPPPGALAALAVRSGEALDPDRFVADCLAAGYIEDDRVDEPGEAARRGEIIDIFPAGADSPARLVLGNGVLEAIRRYDPLTQRTTEEIDALAVDPASELPRAEAEAGSGDEHWLPLAYDRLASLWEHGPGARLILEKRAGQRAEDVIATIAAAYRDRVRTDAAEGGTRPALPPEALYLSLDEWADAREEASTLQPLVEAGPPHAFATERRPQSAFTAAVEAAIALGRSVLVTAAAASELRSLARAVERATGTRPEAVDSWAAACAEPPRVRTLTADLDRGAAFADPPVTIIAARDVLGSRARGGDDAPVTLTPWQIEGDALRLGDTVVHVDHGVGVLRGLETINAQTGAEAIRLEYAKRAQLLVPVEAAGKLWRYGAEEGMVTLDRLKGGGWAKRRAAIDTEIATTARHLIALAAERAERQAPKVAPPAAEYERFATGFAFQETPDQRRAIADVLADLASGRPMDRLIIGDVGYGKTEVALRAAAAVALSGRQVAVVAPTTVLARQHFGQFERRFSATAVAVAHLSRLSTPAEARAVRQGLADGSVRIVIGTHALAAESVAFADLGLVVIDEEQRFGAAHKDRLRALGEGVHVLTLTATPIPRTLQTALAGLQDLSIILTAPARRRPIRTFVAPDDPATVKAALMRERRRGGQSFVVVPRVEDVEPALAELTRLAPDLRLMVAHGKRPAREVDETMVAFAEGKGDVLVATSIIESGLDVPRANTMIVRRADLFGLAQLHQLRGRVGRGRSQGVCYLFTEGEPSDAVARRLGTLQAFDRLGAGMAISARDLDLRGAGDLTGEDQAGHMKLIGLGLYQELLAGAIATARGEEADDWVTELGLDAGGTIPPEYVPEEELRLTLYHRLARARTADDVDALAEEIADRFGPPPTSVELLLASAATRALARTLKVTRLSGGPAAIALEFPPGRDLDREFAPAFARLNGVLERKGERMVFRKASADGGERLAAAREVLEAISL